MFIFIIKKGIKMYFIPKTLIFNQLIITTKILKKIFTESQKKLIKLKKMTMILKTDLKRLMVIAY